MLRWVWGCIHWLWRATSGTLVCWYVWYAWCGRRTSELWRGWEMGVSGWECECSCHGLAAVLAWWYTGLWLWDFYPPWKWGIHCIHFITILIWKVKRRRLIVSNTSSLSVSVCPMFCFLCLLCHVLKCYFLYLIPSFNTRPDFFIQLIEGVKRGEI